MAATHALLTAVCSAGDHVVIPGDLYGGTFRLVDKVLARWGLEYTMVDQTDLDALAAAVREDTRLIWVETPTNPLLNVVDIAAVVARSGGAFVAVDNTFATPINQRPLELGADAVVHSATKYLAGHSDTVGGAVITATRRTTRRCASCRTPSARSRARSTRSSPTAGCARWRCGCAPTPRTPPPSSRYLQEAEGVSAVRWPGFSGMVSFRHPDATGIAERTRLFTLAESLGGVESLIEVPQAMTHQSVEGSAAAVPPDLVRLSVGIEDAGDLVADLRQALTAG